MNERARMMVRMHSVISMLRRVWGVLYLQIGSCKAKILISIFSYGMNCERSHKNRHLNTVQYRIQYRVQSGTVIFYNAIKTLIRVNNITNFSYVRSTIMVFELYRMRSRQPLLLLKCSLNDANELTRFWLMACFKFQ